jgi:hypothetical protein
VELHTLYTSPNITGVIKSRMMMMMMMICAGYTACIKNMRNAYNILVEKSEGKRSLVFTRG